MFRGDSPRNRLKPVSSDSVYAVSSKTAYVSINSLRLSDVDEAAKKFVLRMALTTEGDCNLLCHELSGPTRGLDFSSRTHAIPSENLRLGLGKAGSGRHQEGQLTPLPLKFGAEVRNCTCRTGVKVTAMTTCLHYMH